MLPLTSSQDPKNLSEAEALAFNRAKEGWKAFQKPCFVEISGLYIPEDKLWLSAKTVAMLGEQGVLESHRGKTARSVIALAYCNGKETLTFPGASKMFSSPRRAWWYASRS